jgi:hypothetical protein
VFLNDTGALLGALLVLGADFHFAHIEQATLAVQQRTRHLIVPVQLVIAVAEIGLVVLVEKGLCGALLSAVPTLLLGCHN